MWLSYVIKIKIKQIDHISNIIFTKNLTIFISNAGRKWKHAEIQIWKILAEHFLEIMYR